MKKYIIVGLLFVSSCFAQYTLPSPVAGGVASNGHSTGGTTTFAQADIYLDAINGSDNTGDGSITNPYQTIDKAKVVLENSFLGSNCGGRSTPIIVLARGSLNSALPMLYFQGSTESFTSSDSGCSASAPVVWNQYPGEYASVSGGQRIVGWTNVSGNLWTITMPDGTYTEGLWVDGNRRYRPRWNVTVDNVGGYGRLQTPEANSVVNPTDPCTVGLPGCVGGVNSGCILYNGVCWDRFHYAPANSPFSTSWTNLLVCSSPTNDIWVTQHERWDWNYHRISGVDTTNHIVTINGQYAELCSSFPNCTQGPVLAGHRLMVENAAQLFSNTVPGQWYLDRTGLHPTLSYYALPGENPNTTNNVIIGVTTPPLIQMTGVTNMYWELGISYDNCTLPNAGYNEQQGSTNLGCSADFVATNVSNYHFDNGNISHTMTHGAWITTDSLGTSSNVYVTNNTAFDCGAGCIYVGKFPPALSDTDANVMSKVFVYNNNIKGCGRVYTSGYCLGFFLMNNTYVSNNEISDGYMDVLGGCIPTAAGCEGGNNSQGNFNLSVTNNLVYNCLEGVNNDGGCIYLVSYGHKNVLISNNRTHDCVGGSGNGDSDADAGYCIYIDNVTGNVKVTNNLTYRSSAANIKMSFGPQVVNFGNQITNNIMAYGRINLFFMGQPVPSALTSFIMKSNLFYFDRTSASTPAFHVQGQCGPYNAPYFYNQSYTSNQYYRTSSDFSADVNAFFTNNIGCKTGFTFRTFAGWQGIGEDTGGNIPAFGIGIPFTNPAYPFDDYTLPNGYTGGIGFVPFDTNAPGRVSNTQRPINPTPIPGWPQGSFNPATDF